MANIDKIRLKDVYSKAKKMINLKVNGIRIEKSSDNGVNI